MSNFRLCGQTHASNAIINAEKLLIKFPSEEL